MDKIKKIIKENAVSFSITLISILFILLLDFLGIFQSLELKAFDFAFGLRGPTSGWTAQHNLHEKETDIVLVELDDESYRLIPYTYPYPRGDVWAKVLENLSLAGAKVVIFDFEFDSPDQHSELMTNLRMSYGFTQPTLHGDIVFADAIRNVKSRGTDVILSSEIVTETTSVPPQYILLPNPLIMSANPITGLVDVIEDRDGFMRRYYTFLPLAHEKDKWHLTIAMKAVHSYLDLSNDIVPIANAKEQKIEYGPLIIPTYGNTPTFLINYAGPPSGKMVPGENVEWKTFPRYPLSNIIDVAEITLSDPLEDTDWMDPFIGKIPEWISMISDPEEKAQTMALFGINKFNVTETPFYNKIVIIGPSAEVFQDTKKTPFYNYSGSRQLTPGMETHANAIQTLLDQNYISIYGGNLDLAEGSFWHHFLLIGCLSLIAMILFSLQNVYITGIGIVVEIIVFISIALGSFTSDFLWIIKKAIHLLPMNIIENMGDWILINSPGIGESAMMPVVAPLAGIFLTYVGNVFYKFIREQKDKRYLKQTFGTYISPDLIDQMFDEKQVPTLGGEEGYNTAFFSDIASFSTFSEKLTAPDLVELLNEYLNAMTNILLDNNGTLDKYIGDAIIGFFGAPVELEDHEYLACLTICQMNNKLEELRQKWKSEGDRWPEVVHNMRHRIGVNCGSLVTGNMGSDMRMSYTMMGDTVNLTSRLESGAKQYGIESQVGEKIYEATKDRMTYRMLDYAIVKGRGKPERTYELISEKGKEPEAYNKLLPLWDKAIELYTNQKWDEAIKAFNICDDLEEKYIGRPTTPCKVYISRCEEFKVNSPGKDWDGSWILTEK